MASKKTVAKKKGSKDVSADPLADLGLDTTPVSPAVVAAAATDAATTSHEEVEVGELEFGTIDFIPSAKRTAGGSKYKFDKLVAPVKNAATGKTAYAHFTVKLQPGVDADKLRRSVQSATTQANRQGSNEGKYFVSRSVQTAGEFVGMQVIRTDMPPTKD